MSRSPVLPWVGRLGQRRRTSFAVSPFPSPSWGVCWRHWLGSRSSWLHLPGMGSHKRNTAPAGSAHTEDVLLPKSDRPLKPALICWLVHCLVTYETSPRMLLRETLQPYRGPSAPGLGTLLPGPRTSLSSSSIRVMFPKLGSTERTLPSAGG